ncbi:MAG: sulfotransferase, partial [Alphaproteobacteria bacterium]|nr:sulfotransferase [Alphaproteobacteria bacterium]
RDVCLSCFQQYFALNAGNVHFLALDRTAAIYAQTMGLWQALRSDPAIASLEVRYEDVVDDFEAAVTGLLEFLGAPWDDAVRNFPATAAGRVIRTPSRDAVTHEIYTSSVGRWKRYEDHLSDILPTLEPLVAAFGYGEK